MARTIQRVKVADIKPLEDEYGNQFLSRDYDLQVNKDYVQMLADSFGPDGEPDEEVKLIRDGDVWRIKAGNSRVRAMQLLGTEECWAVIDDEDTVQSVLETVVRTNVKKKYEPVEESRFVQQLAMFGDDEYVGEVSCLGTEKASKLRRGRALAGDKAEQMTLERLSAVSDFEGSPEWVDELLGASEETWRTVASRLRRKKEEQEQVEGFKAALGKFKIDLVEDRPDDLRYIASCDDPDGVVAAYMSASAENQAIVARISSSWSGVGVDFYGEPLNPDAEAEAEAERRRAEDECLAKARAVDESVYEWMTDRWLYVYEGEFPGDFRVLLEHCIAVAHDQYWVKDVMKEFKSIYDEEDCTFLFLLGYKSARKKLESYYRPLMSDDPGNHWHADGLRKALRWVKLHEEDGWEPDEGMAEFLADARAKMAAKGGD